MLHSLYRAIGAQNLAGKIPRVHKGNPVAFGEGGVVFRAVKKRVELRSALFAAFHEHAVDRIIDSLIRALSAQGNPEVPVAQTAIVEKQIGLVLVVFLAAPCASFHADLPYHRTRQLRSS